MLSNENISNRLPNLGGSCRRYSIIIVLGLIVVTCLVLFGVYNAANSLQHDAVERMQSLTATMAQEQVVFSEINLNQKTSYAGYTLAVEGIESVTTSMIQGKFNDTYPEDRNCNAEGECEHYAGDPIPGEINAGLVINALHEAYPDLTAQAIADLASTMISQIRSDQVKFSNTQQLRLDEARSFNTWMNEDLFRSWVLKNIWKIPGENENLYFFLNGEKIVGQDALDYMLRPIVSADAGETYESGVQDGVLPMPGDDN